MFDTRNQSGPYFSEIFVQFADIDEKNYSIAGFVNATQPQTSLSAATYMLQSIMRAELQNPNFRLNFLQAQLPFGMEWQSYINTGIGLLSSLGFAIAYMMISDTLMMSLIKEKQLAIRHQIIISGGSKLSYWLSHYLIDVITHGIPATLTLISVVKYEVDAPNVDVLFVWFCFTNPLFIYCFQYLFKHDG